MKRFPIPILAAAVLLAPLPGRALTFFDLPMGDEALFPDARSVAMGRTRLAEDAGAFTGTTNPARLAWIGDPRVATGGGVQKLKETRATPAYDSFDAFVVESIYALNDGYQYRGGVGAVASAPSEWGLGELGVGISWAPERDYQYDYSEEVRDNNAFTQPRDRLIAVNELQSDGTLDALTLSAGWAPDPRVAVGAGIQILRGERDVVQRVRFQEPQAVMESAFDLGDISGERGVFGVALRPNHRLDAAVTLKTETTLSGDVRLRDAMVTADSVLAVETTGSGDLRYPLELGFGLAYHPRAKVRTTLRVEAVWTEWSQFRDEVWTDLGLEDTWDFRVGLEHVFYNGFPARFGIHYRPSPRDNEVATTTFTFGGGLDVGALHADLGFEVASRDYRYPDLFDDALFGGTTHARKDRVDESSVTVYGTLSYAVPGFGG